MTGKWLCAAMLALAAIPACQADDRCIARRIDERAAVGWIIDGDTLGLRDGRHLRLVGINAPERAHPATPAEPYAEAARQAMASMLPRGTVVLLEYDRERRDRHGRTLAHAFLNDGTNLQERMVRLGLGLRLTLPPNLHHQACYRAAEAAARQARQGLWSAWPALPLAFPGTPDSEGRFRLIEGRVGAVRKLRGGWRLQIDNGITLRIDARTRRDFDGFDVQRLPGRRILARGYVYRWRGRPWMNLDHPSNLEIPPALLPPR